MGDTTNEMHLARQNMVPHGNESCIHPGQGPRGAHWDQQDGPAHNVLDALKLLQGAPPEHPYLRTVKDRWYSQGCGSVVF